MNTTKLESKLELSTIRNFLALIGILVGFVGMISIDTYYAQFGLQYSDLELPFSHLIYRGFSVIMINPYILIPYLLAALWISLLGRESIPSPLHIIKPNYVSMIVIVFVLAITSHYLGRHAGYKAAGDAMTPGKTSLPAVYRISLNNEAERERLKSVTELRLLTFSGDFAVFTTLVDDPDTQSPYTFFIRQDNIDALKLY